jgi:hypothetical protein
MVKLNPKYTKDQIQKLYRKEGKTPADAKRLSELLENDLIAIRRRERRLFRDARKHEKNYGLDLDQLYQCEKETKNASRVSQNEKQVQK